jgi:Zn-dependent peptidase ImmA (M78 family)
MDVPGIRGFGAGPGNGVCPRNSAKPGSAARQDGWLSKDKALLMLSLRHKSDDHFWFSFFHEAAHILLHGKKMLFADEVNSVDTPEEHEANRFAANLLIPARDFQRFTEKGDCKSKKAILAFAKRLGIAPGIVVGRMQHEEIIPFSWHADLKRKFEIVSTN